MQENIDSDQENNAAKESEKEDDGNEVVIIEVESDEGMHYNESSIDNEDLFVRKTTDSRIGQKILILENHDVTYSKISDNVGIYSPVRK